MKFNITLLFFCGIIHSSFGQTDFSVSKIPDSLLVNADAVVRFDETEFTIESYEKIKTKHHWAVTVLNEKGEEKHALFIAAYDKFTKIKKIEGTIYDKNGVELKNLKQVDIKDVSFGSGDYVTDSRAKIAKFNKKFYPYPYTVEFSYEDESTNTLFYPTWMPISSENTGVQSSIFIVKTVDGTTFRKKEMNLKSASKKSKEGEYTVEKWEVSTIPPFEAEPFSLPTDLPIIVFAPQKYTVDGYTGKLDTWNDIAQFYKNVNVNRDILPQETIERLTNFIGQENDVIKKTKKVYEFMQSHTRYFLVALGIGGWQSTLAKEVAQKGYGDCKALSNYTIALLKAVNIKAYPALVYANSESKNRYELQDFPRMSFNHVIVCVPVEKDTLWLECTSQTNPFGYLGSFTGNRNLLLVKDNEGNFISSLTYFPTDNIQKRQAKITFDSTGNANVVLNSLYSGLQQETRAYLAENLTIAEQKKWLYDNIEIPNLEILDFKLIVEKERFPKVKEDITLVSKRYISFNGNRIFFKPNLMTTFINSTTKDRKERKEEFYLNPNKYSFVDEDTIEFEIPEGYVLEYLPKDIELKHNFGEFTSKSLIVGNKLQYARKLKTSGGLYPKTDYDNWIEFLKKIYKSDNQKAVFVKK